MVIRNFVEYPGAYPIDALEEKDLEFAVFQPQMAEYLSYQYGWSKEQIQALFGIYTTQEIQDVLELIQTEYRENNLVSYWERPTSKYLYDVLLSAKPN